MAVELDTDVINQTAVAVRAGEWPIRALVRLGVNQEAATAWMRDGEEQAHEGQENDLTRLYRAVDVAEADCEKFWLEQAVAAARDGKRTAAFTGWMTLLERRFPDRYCVRGVQNRRKQGQEAESLEEMVQRLTNGD